MVRVGCEPAPIDSQELDAIRVIVNSGASAEPYPHLVEGERVVMRGGPFHGLSGTMVEFRNSLRLVVSVELLCRSVLVEIDREWIVPFRLSELA